MKKFKKVASFVAAFTMALAVVMPTVAKADVTINATKPADWQGMNIHAWGVNGDITTWPGIALTQNGDKYTITIEAEDTDKVSVILNDGTSQTTNIDGLTDTNGQGEGLEAGTYDVTIGTTKNNMGHFNWTLTKTGATSSASTTDTTTVAEATNAPAASSPSTADTTQLAALASIALVAAASVVVFLRRRMAA